MKLKHLFYAAAISTLAAACSEADELSSGIRSEKTLDAIHSGTDRFATRVNLNSEWESGDAIGVYMRDAATGSITPTNDLSDNLCKVTAFGASSTDSSPLSRSK